MAAKKTNRQIEEELNRSSIGVVESSEYEQEENPSKEVLDLRAKVAQLEKEKSDRLNSELLNTDENAFIKELEVLRRKSKTGLNEIKYKEIMPEMIKLWHVSGHNVGKMVGPIVLEQAEETFLRFRKFGVRLSATKPTPEWIEQYKKTAEYKKAAEIETKRREGKQKTRKESEVEKLTQAIAKMEGIAIDKVNSIKSEGDVKMGKQGDKLNQFARV